MDLFNKTYISTATTTQVTTGPTALVFINVNKTLTGTVTIQDGNGTTNTTIGILGAGTAPQSFHYDKIIMSRGIRIITSAADDLTIITN